MDHGIKLTVPTGTGLVLACRMTVQQRLRTPDVWRHTERRTCLSQRGWEWQAAADGMPTRNSCTSIASLLDTPANAICLSAHTKRQLDYLLRGGSRSSAPQGLACGFQMGVPEAPWDQVRIRLPPAAHARHHLEQAGQNRRARMPLKPQQKQSLWTPQAPVAVLTSAKVPAEPAQVVQEPEEAELLMS